MVDLSKGYAVLDLETSGIHPLKGDRVLEIGIGIQEPDKELVMASCLVNPGLEVPWFVENATGLHTGEHQRLAMPPGWCFKWAHRAMMNLPIVGHHNIWGDRLFFEKELERAGAGPHILAQYEPQRWIDTSALWKAYQLGAGPNSGERHCEYAERVLGMKVTGMNYQLRTACEHLGLGFLPQDHRHRARDDVMMCYELFNWLLEAGVPLEAEDAAGPEVPISLPLGGVPPERYYRGD